MNNEQESVSNDKNVRTDAKDSPANTPAANCKGERSTKGVFLANVPDDLPRAEWRLPPDRPQ
jgi:hypothetical protein